MLSPPGCPCTQGHSFTLPPGVVGHGMGASVSLVRVVVELEPLAPGHSQEATWLR